MTGDYHDPDTGELLHPTTTVRGTPCNVVLLGRGDLFRFTGARVAMVERADHVHNDDPDGPPFDGVRLYYVDTWDGRRRSVELRAGHRVDVVGSVSSLLHVPHPWGLGPGAPTIHPFRPGGNGPPSEPVPGDPTGP